MFTSIQNVDCSEDVQRQSHLNYQRLCGPLNYLPLSAHPVYVVFQPFRKDPNSTFKREAPPREEENNGKKGDIVNPSSLLRPNLPGLQNTSKCQMDYATSI